MKSYSHHTACRCKTGCLIFLFIFNGFAVWSQSVREITTRDGLPQSFVSGLVQDDSSFVWIGTRNGLARYDGIHFKVFQHNSRDSSTLATNLIIWLRKDRQNQLWIEHESGTIDRMNPVTEKITHILKGNRKDGGMQFIRRGWMADEEGIFWGIPQAAGLNAYDIQSGKTSFYNKQNSSLPGDTVLGIVETGKKEIWVLGQGALSRLDKKTNRFVNWPIPFHPDYGSFPDVNAIAIDLHERKNGELLWGDRQKLFFFNTETHQFKSVSLPSVAYLGIRWIRTDEEGVDYFENFGKVYRYSEAEGLQPIGRTIMDSYGDVKSFLVDRSGLIWLGTNAGGIHQIDLETPFFQSFKYKKGFAADMMQQELGLDMVKTFRWTTADDIYAQPGYHLRWAYDDHKRLYLALKETVCYYDSLHKKYISLPVVPLIGKREKLRIAIKGITVNADGEPMVIGYNGHVMTYDSAQGRWLTFLDSLALKKQFGAGLLPLDILADNKNIWISTEGSGLIKMDIHTKEMIRLTENLTPGSLPANQLLGLEADPRNPDILWIGSYQGLIRLNKNTLACEVFSLKEGLPDNTIYSILPDASGNLWLSTNNGICRFDPLTHQVRAFHTEHGLPGDEYNRFYQLQFPDGRITFGGTEGWTLFDPLRIKKDVFDPAVAFTDIRINNKELPRVKENKEFLPINALQQLSLPYEQNTVSFGFAGLEFSQPQDLAYRYRLEGYDNDWIMADKNRQAIYTKIPPGHYTLLVNASNTSGKWSEHIRSLKMNIESPWWATRMAYLCYCIILAGLTWTIMRFRVSRIVMKQEMLLKEKEALQLKEVDDMKSRFFSNITHEFRTPLTLIMGPAEQLKSAQAMNPQQSKWTDTILSNAKQLLILINRLMDLSKLEARALRLQEQRGNPADTVGSIVYSFQNDAEARELTLLYEDGSGQADCWYYADALERIVYNLVSNALKFTPAGGQVEVNLAIAGEALQLVVKDNGTGIDEKKLPYIFDRFYQAGEHAELANEEWDRGTGIGLSLVKELVNQIKGEIRVESKTGAGESGTLFTVRMPVRPEKNEEAVVLQTEEESEQDIITGPEENRIPQILLVEDNPELAGFITGILSAHYSVAHVLNGQEGIEEATDNMPDLILSDVMMPVMDGYEMTGRLKEDIRTSHIPIILLTAKVTQENLLEGLSKGADDYLTKPFHPTELLLRIHNLFDRQRKLRERFREEFSLPDGSAPVKEELPQDIFLTRLYAVLDEHLDDSVFGVDQLTDTLNMSRSSLHRKLKALTGMATTEVVRNYRLKMASHFLREGFSSSDAAYKSGFGSPAYFTKSFREVFGITPGDYIRSLKPF